jgi:pimeloyl-ACP methyl ester carboxylesterase
MRWKCIALVLLLAAHAVHAEGRLFRVPTRQGVSTTLFWEEAVNARATVLLFPGGGGGFGKVEAGRATSNNFLVRSAPHFIAQGFNVAIFGRPSDSDELDYADRVADPHMTDVGTVLAFVRAKADAPVWVIGTSRGTVSATAMAIRMQDQLAGLVLTSSVVSLKKPGAVPGQELATIRLPVLLLHHARDACAVCRPDEVPAILRGLKNAPVKKLILTDGGRDPSGDPCAALHWHGYVGMEREAVDLIADWLRKPVE